jgi:hypothetical protein
MSGYNAFIDKVAAWYGKSTPFFLACGPMSTNVSERARAAHMPQWVFYVLTFPPSRAQWCPLVQEVISDARARGLTAYFLNLVSERVCARVAWLTDCASVDRLPLRVLRTPEVCASVLLGDGARAMAHSCAHAVRPPTATWQAALPPSFGLFSGRREVKTCPAARACACVEV